MLTTITKMFRKLAGWPDPDPACDACRAPEPPEGRRRPEARATGNAAFSIRPATHTDLAAVRRLLAASSLPVQGVEAQFGEQYAVALADGLAEVVGVAGYEVYGRDGLLRSAAVDPAWRGQGIGAALTRDRIAAADGRGLNALYALTTTAADYFPRFGFQVIDREEVPPAVKASSEFDEVCPSTATVLRLDLGDSAGAGDP